jgi:glutamyl-tRNA reductase
MQWVQQRHAVPLIRQLHMQTDAWRQLELARAGKQLARGVSPELVLEALSKGLTQKILHGAMKQLHADDALVRERASFAIEHFFLRKER